MGQYLRYWWTLAVLHSSATQTIYGKNVWVRWKPALWFVRGSRATSDIVSDLLDGSAPDKHAHPWAQEVDEVRPLIRALSTPGGLVVDPMAGSGAFLWAAYLEGRRALGFEVDEERYAAGRGWLMERYAAHVGREEVGEIDEEVEDAAAD
jgi:DNA modification methylase